MADRARFEERLIDELARMAGPPRPVDARSIRLAAQATAGRRPWSVLTGRRPADTIQPAQGGSRTMFSAAKLVAATAIVALTGGLLLAGIIGPGQEEAQAPGAEISDPSPSPLPFQEMVKQNAARWQRVSGTQRCTQTREGTGEDEIGALFHDRDYGYRCVAELNEPFGQAPGVGGTYEMTINSDFFTVDDAPAETDYVVWGTYVLDDPEAGWDCTFTGSTNPDHQNAILTFGTCPGTGANQGWTYVYQALLGIYGDETFKDGSSIRGVVYEGDPPPRADVAG